jgi:hypothetical protein
MLPTPLSLSQRELEIVIAAAAEMESPADRVRLLENLADELMHQPKTDPAIVALAVRVVLKRLRNHAAT